MIERLKYSPAFDMNAQNGKKSHTRQWASPVDDINFSCFESGPSLLMRKRDALYFIYMVSIMAGNGLSIGNITCGKDQRENRTTFYEISVKFGICFVTYCPDEISCATPKQRNRQIPS